LGNKAIKFKSRTFYVLNVRKNASFATKYRTERRDLEVSPPPSKINRGICR
jgi:hypothetical protein